jgi:hypothetical protein
MYFNAWRRSVRPKHAACTDKSKKNLLWLTAAHIYFNMIYHNRMNSTKIIKSKFNPVHGLHTLILFLRLQQRILPSPISNTPPVMVKQFLFRVLSRSLVDYGLRLSASGHSIRSLLLLHIWRHTPPPAVRGLAMTSRPITHLNFF